jgi:radical SAM superfamily enzyme YgiQ (UPF0313 family)
MKVIISYPPLNTIKGCVTLGQNRQLQYFKEPTYIYPVVPAQAATLLKQAGHQVIWNDCIAENYNYAQFLDLIRKENPDLIAFEAKTPVIKQHWKIINEIKSLLPNGPKIVLFGDHVSALPDESLRNCEVDFVLTGGDYDFLLLNLCNTLSKPPAAGSQKIVEGFEPGIYYRDSGQIKNSGKFKLDHNLDSLPFIDRDLSKWKLYAFCNGNYKRTPGTYIMSGRDCWYHRCSFCSWTTLYPEFRSRSPDNVLNEIDMLAEKYKVREIMDDTGCFPVGAWLGEFCRGMIRRGLNKKVYFDCNMRFGALKHEDFALMKKANFRLLLFGLESGNQGTLDRINKGLKVEEIAEGCKLASSAGLYPHITIMFGYPWESYQQALKTLELGRYLLKKGYAYTMQATIVIPYPGTPLFQECKEAGLLDSLDWDNYDMKQPIMRTDIPQKKMMGLVQGMYSISFDPQFILRKIFSIRDLDDLKYYSRGLKKVFGHIFDFEK